MDARAERKTRLRFDQVDRELARRPAPPAPTYHRDAMLERLRGAIKRMPEGATRQAMEILYLMETQR